MRNQNTRPSAMFDKSEPPRKRLPNECFRCLNPLSEKQLKENVLKGDPYCDLCHKIMINVYTEDDLKEASPHAKGAQTPISI